MIRIKLRYENKGLEFIRVTALDRFAGKHLGLNGYVTLNGMVNRLDLTDLKEILVLDIILFAPNSGILSFYVH